MSSPELFSIIVDNISGVYSPGDVITGFVFKLFRRQTKNVRITCRGRAMASLDGHDSSNIERRLRFKGIQYLLPKTSNKEYFLLSSVCLDEYINSCNSTNDSEDEGETDGANSTSSRHPMLFQFQLRLPSLLPPSCNLLYGFVSYDILFEWQSLRGNVEWDHTTKTIPISIGASVNLNLIPFSSEPCEATKQENFRFLCCNSGSLYVNLKLNKMGYIPGEEMHFTVVTNNSTKFDVERIEVTLRKESCFYVGELKKKFCKNLVTVEGPSCTRGSSILWKDFIIVPDVPYKFFWPCTLIKISFLLQIKLITNTYFQSPRTVLENSVTVLIGDIPVNQEIFPERFSIPLHYGMSELSSCFQGLGGTDLIGFNCLFNDALNLNRDSQITIDDSTPPYATLFTPATVVESPPPSYEVAVKMLRPIRENEEIPATVQDGDTEDT